MMQQISYKKMAISWDSNLKTISTTPIPETIHKNYGPNKSHEMTHEGMYGIESLALLQNKEDSYRLLWHTNLTSTPYEPRLLWHTGRFYWGWGWSSIYLIQKGCATSI